MNGMDNKPFYPMVFCFIPSCLGIMLSYAFCFSLNVWIFCFIVSLIFAAFSFYCNHFLDFIEFHTKKLISIPLFDQNEYLSTSDRNPYLRNDHSFLKCFLAFLVILTFFGFWHSFCWNYYPKDHIRFLISKENTPAIIQGYLTSSPKIFEPNDREFGQIFEQTATTIFDLEVESILNNNVWQKIKGKVRIIVRSELTHLKIGDRVQICGLLNPLKSPSNPNDFDQEFQLRSERILLQMNVPQSESIRFLSQNRSFFVLRFFETLRTQAAQMFDAELSEENAQIAKAITLGIRSSLDNEMIDLFRETGTIHFLAISGLHLALFAKIIHSILLIFGCPRRFLSLTLIGSVIFYLFLTEGQTPSIRAAVLIIIVCGGLLFQRTSFNINSLAAAAVIVLLINPNELFLLGAQLSFLATGVFLWTVPQKRNVDSNDAQGRMDQSTVILLKIIFKHNLEKIRAYFDSACYFLFYKLFKHCFSKGTVSENMAFKRTLSIFRNAFFFILKKAFRLFIISCIIWLVLLPLILQHFNLLTPIAIFINPIIWIPMLLSLFFCLVFIVLSWVCPFLCPLASFWIEISLDLFRYLLEAAHYISLGRFWLPGPTPFWSFCFYLPLIFWTICPSKRPHIKFLLLFFIIWGIGEVGAFYYQRHQDLKTQNVCLNIFSVGHGMSILITTPEHRNILYDCGSLTSSPRYVAQIIAQALWKQGKTNIDLVIFSHADADHYNAFEQLNKLLTINAVCASPVMFQKENEYIDQLEKMIVDAKIPFYSVVRNDSLDFIGFPMLKILHPSAEQLTKDSTNNANENSLVILLEHLGRSILLTGDLDASQAGFLENDSPVKLDLLMAPHHGGKSQNYQALLDWGQPTFVVITGGRFQRNIESEKSLRSKGFSVLNTYSNGCIQVNISSSENDSLASGQIEVKMMRTGQNEDYFAQNIEINE